MSKALTLTKRQAVAIAKKEIMTLRDHRKRPISKADRQEERTYRKEMPVPDPGTAQHPFYCSEHPGKVSIMTLKLTDKTATTGMATPVSNRAIGDVFETGNDDLAFFKRELRISHDYGGCPHCHRKSMVRCSQCGALSCHQVKQGSHTCPQCGRKAKIITGNVTLDIARQMERETCAEPMKALPRLSQSTALVIHKK